MRTIFIILFSISTINASFSQSMQIASTSAEAEAAFIEAREILSSVWITGGIDKMKEALVLDSTLAVAHVYVGVSNAFISHDRKESFRKALHYSKNASSCEQWMIKGWIYFFSGKRDSAAFAYENVLKDCPDDDYTRHILGDVYRTQDRYEEALAMLKPIANRKENPYTHALNHTGYTYLKMEMMDSAFHYIERFIDSNPKNANAYDTMADMYIHEGNLNAALSYYQRAVLADDRFASAQRNIGDLLVELGEPDLARIAYKKAIEISELYGDSFREKVEKKIKALEID